MTTKRELAEILIKSEETGREIEVNGGGLGWNDTVDFPSCNYRLKPVTTYYRVFEDNGVTRIHRQDSPFEPWPGIFDKHLFDHEVSE